MPSRAHGGTLYLEDVAELEIGLQTKLLRWLETGMVESEGGAAQVPSDARIVCGGPRDPRSDVQAGRLREDLFFRLNVISIALPPVREREDDAVCSRATRYAVSRPRKASNSAISTRPPSTRCAPIAGPAMCARSKT